MLSYCVVSVVVSKINKANVKRCVARGLFN